MQDSDRYPAISQFEPHTYGWAMDQLAAGNEVRRWRWPIEVRGSWDTGKNAVYIWHVYRLNDYGGKCKGFSSGVVGADNDYYEELGVDSMGYTPSYEDFDAIDWQTVDEVTQEQIEYMDARRYRHWPSGEQYVKQEIKPKLDDAVIWIVISVMMMVLLMLLFRRW